MNFSKSVKILMGLATGFYALAPILFVLFYFLWMFAMIPMIAAAEQPPVPDFPRMQFFFFFAAMFVIFFAVIMLFNFLHISLIPIYITLLIKNKTGREFLRIIIAIGLFILPFIAMPAYYLIYILPMTAPDWALEPQSTVSASTQIRTN